MPNYCFIWKSGPPLRTIKASLMSMGSFSPLSHSAESQRLCLLGCRSTKAVKVGHTNVHLFE